MRSAARQHGRGNSLSTVRIYKVAELLSTTSQEVTALLKRDHGIEVKSASSTIEEVVARQFVERLARQRNIALPTRRHLRRDSRRQRQEEPAGEEAGRAGQARGSRVAAATPGQGRQAAGRGPPPKPKPSPMPNRVAEAPEKRSRRSRAPGSPSRRPARRLEERRTGETPGRSPARGAPGTTIPRSPAPPPKPPRRPHRAADVAAAHRRTAADDTDAAVADARRAARRAATEGRPSEHAGAATARDRRAARQRTGTAAGSPQARAGREGTGRPGGPPPPPRPAYPGPRPQAPVGGPRPLPSQPVRTQTAGPAAAAGQTNIRSGPGCRIDRRCAKAARDARRPVSAATRVLRAPPMPSAPPPVTRTITLAEGMTVKDLADKLELRVRTCWPSC